MSYYKRLLDAGDKSISQEREYALREAFDWIEQNPDVKTVDELVELRRVWLTSKEYEIFSGVMPVSELSDELALFRTAAVELQTKQFAR